MTENVFIDTNLLIYAYTDNIIEKHENIKHFLIHRLVKANVFISTQVLGEFYNVLTKKKLRHEDICKYLDEIIKSINVLLIDVTIFRKALDLKNCYQLSWWDSLILATAIENNCQILYSEDLQNDQIIDNKFVIKNPLLLYI